MGSSNETLDLRLSSIKVQDSIMYTSVCPNFMIIFVRTWGCELASMQRMNLPYLHAHLCLVHNVYLNINMHPDIMIGRIGVLSHSWDRRISPFYIQKLSWKSDRAAAVTFIDAIKRTDMKFKLILSIVWFMNTMDKFAQIHIQQGASIVTNLCRGYNSLRRLVYEHMTLNNSTNFANPLNIELHTQNIERLWHSLGEFSPSNVHRDGIAYNLALFCAWHNYSVKTMAEKFNIRYTF